MKTSTIRLLFVLAATVGMAITSVSCNTFRGFGRDVERTGDHISNAAR